MAEPLEGLQRIAAHAAELAQASPQEAAFPDPAPLTPSSVPRAELVTDPPGTWNHPTWRRLDFSLSVPHAYGFEFQSGNAKDRSWFAAHARGDLDGDGVLSDFELDGELLPGKGPKISPLEVTREVE